MSQSYSYPTSSALSIGAEGNNGTTAPGQSLLVAGKNNSGNLTPLAIDAAGNLLVSLSADVITAIPTTDEADGPVTPGAVAAKSILTGAQYNIVLPTLTNAQQCAVQVDSSGRIIIAPLTNSSIVKSQLQDDSGNGLSSTSGSLNTLIPDISASGSITSTQTVTIAVNGLATAGIQVTGTWTGTLAVEGSVDGTNYNSTTAAFLANGQLVSNITSNAIYQANLSGLVSFRIRGNTIGSGTAVVTIRGNATPAMVMLDNSLPAGSATIGAVTQASGPWTMNLTQVGSSGITQGQKAMAASIPVVLASDQSTITTTNASVGANGSAAKTSSTLIAVSDGTNQQQLIAPIALGDGVNGNNSVAQVPYLYNGTSFDRARGDTTNGAWVNVKTSSLPTGAATATNQSTANTSLASIDTKTPALVSGRVPVDGSGVTQPVSITGRAKANTPVLNDYSVTPVTSSAYVQLIASTTSTANMIEIFDSSGQTIYLAVGPAASEVNQLIIVPGGNGQVPIAIPSGSRVSVKATGTSATSGILVINLYT